MQYRLEINKRYAKILLLKASWKSLLGNEYTTSELLHIGLSQLFAL